MAKSTLKKVIVRADRAGVYFGTLVSQSEDGKRVELKDARLIHFWRGRMSTLDIAVAGVGEGSRVSAVAAEITLTDAISVIGTTPEAVKNLEGFVAWRP